MAKKFSRRALFLSALLAALIFVASGYLLSDAFFFRRLVARNRITSPEEAFAFVNNNTGVADPRNTLPLTYSPREMLTRQKDLFCDQSAILLATIVGEIGYESRLVDFVGDDGVSRHTILEVKQGGGWKTYDTQHRVQGASYEQLRGRVGYQARPVYRTYAGSRWVNRNNYYLQRLALWLRRARGG